MTSPHEPHDDRLRPDPYIEISSLGRIKKKKSRRTAHDYQPSLSSPPGITTGRSARKVTPTPKKGKRNGLSILWSFIVVIIFIVMAAKGVLDDGDDEPSDVNSSDVGANEWSQETDDSDWLGVNDMRQEYFDENAQNAKPGDETQTLDDWDITVEKATLEMDEFFTENQFSNRPFEDNVAVIVRAKNLGSTARDFTFEVGISDPGLEFQFDGLCPQVTKYPVQKTDVEADDEITFATCIPATVDDFEDASLWIGTSYSDENRVSWELPDDLVEELDEAEK